MDIVGGDVSKGGYLETKQRMDEEKLVSFSVSYRCWFAVAHYLEE